MTTVFPPAAGVPAASPAPDAQLAGAPAAAARLSLQAQRGMTLVELMVVVTVPGFIGQPPMVTSLITSRAMVTGA